MDRLTASLDDFYEFEDANVGSAEANFDKFDFEDVNENSDEEHINELLT